MNTDYTRPRDFLKRWGPALNQTMTGAGTTVAHGTGAHISPVLLAMGKLRNICLRKMIFLACQMALHSTQFSRHSESESARRGCAFVFHFGETAHGNHLFYLPTYIKWDETDGHVECILS